MQRRGGDDAGVTDYRYSLANERTFLAGVRTSLALLAGSLGVVGFRHALGGHRWASIAIAAILAISGLCLSGASYFRWASVESAMKNHQPLPRPRHLLILTAIVGCVGAVVLAVVLTM